jgi:Na+-transporting NADH:ubiquinone oxidoreductase subunit F
MTTVVIASVAAFTIIIVLLVLLLLFAQAKLVQSGDVKIVINGDEANPLVVPAGSSLLSTLSNQKIFLPSACGGGGTCAMCYPPRWATSTAASARKMYAFRAR